jgi:hypothetical protein
MKNLNDYYQHLSENEVAKGINQALINVDDSLSYKDFAIGVAAVLKDEYGSHNFTPFMKVLHAELGIDESLNENEDLSSLDDFLEYFKSYDAYSQYIDDGGQYKRAQDNNDRILARFNALSSEDREVALKAVMSYFKDEKAINSFK